MNNVVAIIVKTLLNLGIAPNTKGYHYLRDVIFMCVTLNEHITNFSKTLYAKLADKY
jgi:two-component system response regulator (stage 0 sporulation protein A)